VSLSFFLLPHSPRARPPKFRAPEFRAPEFRAAPLNLSLSFNTNKQRQPNKQSQTVASLCRNYKALLAAAALPRVGVAPLVAAALKLQPRPGVLTPAHADCLQL